ncbi:unnamed protein product, partial [Meganyctiphanes norvegica]
TMDPNQPTPALFRPVDTYVHEPLLNYLVILIHSGYLSMADLFDIIDFLVDRGVEELLNAVVSDQHTCHYWDLPDECCGEDMPTLNDVLDHLHVGGHLTKDDMDFIKSNLEDLDISDILSLQ